MYKAYILNKDSQYYKMPRIFIEDDRGYTIAAANCTEPTRYGISLYLLKLNKEIHPIDIYKAKWVHPHLLKNIKKDLEIQK